MIVEGDAREQLEGRYLGGRPSLLSEGEADWDRLAEQVEQLWSLGEKLALEDLSEQTSQMSIGNAEVVLDQRVAERAKTIADDARVSTFERLGELPRAVAIMERRLAPRAQPTE